MPMFDPRIFDRKIFDTPKIVTTAGGGARWQARQNRKAWREQWKTTEDILRELREKKDEELQALQQEPVPVTPWPLPVDDWQKRTMVIKMVLEEREVQRVIQHKRRKKKRVAVELLMMDD